MRFEEPRDLRLQIHSQDFDLSDAQRAQMEGALRTLRRAARRFPICDLHVNIRRHPRAGDFHVKAALLLPQEPLFTGERDMLLFRAFERWAEDPHLLGAHTSTVEMVLALLAIVLLVGCVRRRPLAETALAAAVVIPPLGSTLWSFGRLSLQAFPLFIVLGGLAARRPAWSLAWLLPSAAGLAFLASLYAGWWWAG